MERTFVGALIAGLFSMSTLAFVWANPGSPQPNPKPEGDWRLLDPISYENITIFPVVTSNSHDTSAYLTLDEGLSSGEVIVREGGGDIMMRDRGGIISERPVTVGGRASVNQLVLINRSKRPLILLAGELVSGGKQDRIIGKDRIVPVGADPLPLDVFCVEHGRWSNGSQFTSSKTMVHPSVREQATLKREQGEVWNAVRAGTTAAAPAKAPAPRMAMSDIAATVQSEAPTESYEKIYESRRVGASVDSFVDEVQRRFAKETSNLKGEHVVGVVIAYGGEIAWSDIFASENLFKQYWTKLLRSYSIEALARPTLREVASREDASLFLGRLNGRERQETEPGVYIWREISEGRLSQIELGALDPKPMIIHRTFIHRTN